MSHALITWLVTLAAPLAGLIVLMLAYRGPRGEQRARMWTQGPFVPAGKDEREGRR